MKRRCLVGLGGVLGWASLTGRAEEHWREEKRRRARGGLVEEGGALECCLYGVGIEKKG